MTSSVTMFPLKVISAGMYRAGTASLSVALNKLGFGPTWHMVTNSQDKTKCGAKWWIDNDVTNKIYNGESVNFNEWLHLIQCSSIMDTPIVHHWDRIFEQFPDCKVILSVRDFESWWKSYEFALQQCTADSFRSKAETDPWIKDIQQQITYYDNADGYNVSEILMLNEPHRKQIYKTEFYDKDIAKVKSIVPQEQLLLFNVNDGWEPLCQFFDVAIPNEPFPKINCKQELAEFVQNL